MNENGIFNEVFLLIGEYVTIQPTIKGKEITMNDRTPNNALVRDNEEDILSE